MLAAESNKGIAIVIVVLIVFCLIVGTGGGRR
jgi:hypothetical protein